MSPRFILAAAAALIPMALSAAPAPARAGERDGLLASLPTHASPGVCYARVRQDAAFTPPGPPNARWRLRPGSPGPIWCLVTEPGAPPVQIRAERRGWLRVRCDRQVVHARVAVPRRPRPIPIALPMPLPPPPMVRGPCCNLAAAPPPPPPVVTIAVPAPVPPRSPWLSWSGKSIY